MGASYSKPDPRNYNSEEKRSHREWVEDADSCSLPLYTKESAQARKIAPASFVHRVHAHDHSTAIPCARTCFLSLPPSRPRLERDLTGKRQGKYSNPCSSLIRNHTNSVADNNRTVLRYPALPASPTPKSSPTAPLSNPTSTYSISRFPLKVPRSRISDPPADAGSSHRPTYTACR